MAAEADVADEVQVRAAFGAVTAALGDIDILFNNAGIDTTSLLVDMPMDMWDEMIRVPTVRAHRDVSTVMSPALTSAAAANLIPNWPQPAPQPKRNARRDPLPLIL